MPLAAVDLAAPASRSETGNGCVKSPRLQATVRHFYVERAGLKPGELVILAVSGGIDSMSLAHASLETAGETGLQFHIAHFDHSLRQDSGADTSFVKQYADAYGIKFESERADVGAYARDRKLGVEEAARELRYRFLLKLKDAVGARFVAVAHNLDDQAETVLLRLIRGAGLRGLRAMEPVGASVIRPLLDVDRIEIERYAGSVGLEHREDPTNEQLMADRNQIRHIVIPALREIRPGGQSALARTAETVGKDLEAIEWAAGEALERCQPMELGEVLELSRQGLAELPDGVMAAVFRHISEERSSDIPPLSEIDAAIAFCREPRSGGSVRLGNSLWILKSAGRLAFAPTHEWQATLGGELPLPIPGTARFPEAGLAVTARILEGVEASQEMAIIDGKHGRDHLTATLDLDSLVGPITVRSGVRGDVFTPYGHKSVSTLARFLGRRRVPVWRRNLAPVVVAGGTIAWVAGIEIANHCRVGPASRRLLRVRLES